MDTDKQSTQHGIEIPIPTRKAVLDDLTKVAGKVRPPVESDSDVHDAEDKDDPT